MLRTSVMTWGGVVASLAGIAQADVRWAGSLETSDGINDAQVLDTIKAQRAEKDSQRNLAIFGSGLFGPFGQAVAMIAFDGDPLLDVTYTIENFSTAPLFVNLGLQHDILPFSDEVPFETDYSVEFIDGNSMVAADGVGAITPASPFFGDASVSSSTSFGMTGFGELGQLGASTLTLADPSASASFSGTIDPASVSSTPLDTLTLATFLTLSPGDTAVVRQRLYVEFIPAPGAAAGFAVGGMFAARRRRG